MCYLLHSQMSCAFEFALMFMRSLCGSCRLLQDTTASTDSLAFQLFTNEIQLSDDTALADVIVYRPASRASAGDLKIFAQDSVRLSVLLICPFPPPALLTATCHVSSPDLPIIVVGPCTWALVQAIPEET